MGAKDTMKTFFAAMNEQVAPTSGYGSKILSTPMGPFAFNDTLGVWVNTSNGMQMNNIAFQDMYAMMDYTPIGGSKDNIGAISTPTINTLTFAPGSQSIDNSLGNVALTPTFTISGNTVPVALKWNYVTGNLSTSVVRYKKNGGVFTDWAQNTSTGAVTFAAGDTLQVFIDATGVITTPSATFRLFNVTDSNAACSNILSVSVFLNA